MKYLHLEMIKKYMEVYDKYYKEGAQKLKNEYMIKAKIV